MSFTTHRALSGRLRRLAAGLGVLAVGTALAFGSAAPASAAPNIDPDATGSITIHKLQEPVEATGLSNNGSVVDTGDIPTINGVTFTAQQVNIELTDSANWQGLEDYTVAQAQGNLLEPVKTEVTAGAGVAAFTGLPVGLYLVTETDTGANGIAFKGEPFLVTIPLALANDWNYDVHVYPKNTVSTLEKSVDDSAAHVIGDPVSFTLTGQVPSLPAADNLTGYGITDTLDARLSYVDATVAVAGVELVDVVDYAITPGPAFSVVFTPAGLEKLDGVQGNAVTVVVNTTVNALGNGTINNQAQAFVNDPGNTFDSNEVTTSWGALKVLKSATGEAEKVLSGAEFELFALDAGGDRITSALANVAVLDAGSTFITAADGTFQVDGLKAGDYELVETKAPLGYKLDATPLKITVTAGSLTDAPVTSVENTQVPAFMLPLTGSTGISLFIGGGLVLIVGGILLAVIRKRRAQRA